MPSLRPRRPTVPRGIGSGDDRNEQSDRRRGSVRSRVDTASPTGVTAFARPSRRARAGRSCRSATSTGNVGVGAAPCLARTTATAADAADPVELETDSRAVAWGAEPALDRSSKDSEHSRRSFRSRPASSVLERIRRPAPGVLLAANPATARAPAAHPLTAPTARLPTCHDGSNPARRRPRCLAAAMARLASGCPRDPPAAAVGTAGESKQHARQVAVCDAPSATPVFAGEEQLLPFGKDGEPFSELARGEEVLRARDHLSLWLAGHRSSLLSAAVPCLSWVPGSRPRRPPAPHAPKEAPERPRSAAAPVC